ncbi:hypothetical protein ED867_20600, partial [Acinetobacter baumannii]
LKNPRGFFPPFWGEKGGPPKNFFPRGKNFSPGGYKMYLLTKKPPGGFFPPFWGEKRGPPKIFFPRGEKIFPPGEKIFWGVFKKPPKKGGPPFF